LGFFSENGRVDQLKMPVRFGDPTGAIDCGCGGGLDTIVVVIWNASGGSGRGVITIKY